MASPDESAIFRAISDPTRREILDLLRDRDLNVREISEQFPVSRPAISKHLRILRESDLVRERRQGRERLYSAHVEPLAVVRRWVAVSDTPWVDGATGGRVARRPSRRGGTASKNHDWRVW